MQRRHPQRWRKSAPSVSRGMQGERNRVQGDPPISRHGRRGVRSFVGTIWLPHRHAVPGKHAQEFAARVRPLHLSRRIPGGVSEPRKHRRSEFLRRGHPRLARHHGSGLDVQRLGRHGEGRSEAAPSGRARAGNRRVLLPELAVRSRGDPEEALKSVE